uniref:IP19117p n=1 Tax=Drosophila melanogaster TaxID=7227 RepID=A1ZB23_DROME
MEALRRFLRTETRCRLNGIHTLILCVLFLGFSVAGEMPDLFTPEPDLTIDECHDEFTIACANASLVFSDSYDLCELNANETIINLEVDVELERLQIELGSSAVCGNMQICDTLVDDLEYFQCINKNGIHNLDILTEINYNATSAYTRLHEDYDAVHRALLLCGLDAQKKYMEDIRQAHRELTKCRSEIDELNE